VSTASFIKLFQAMF